MKEIFCLNITDYVGVVLIIMNLLAEVSTVFNFLTDFDGLKEGLLV